MKGLLWRYFFFGGRGLSLFYFSPIMTGLAEFNLVTAAMDLETESNFLCWITDIYPLDCAEGHGAYCSHGLNSLSS